MSDRTNVLLPSKPRVISEEGFSGIYEIDGLYPGYGHTLGNSLRRIILSSLTGAAITSIKIEGVEHEFSTLAGVKEDIINIILNLKKVRIKMLTDEPQKAQIKIKGIKDVTAGDITVPGQLEILNPEAHIATLTDKNADLSVEITVESGLGYVPKEVIQKDRVEIGTIALDAIFTPIRRVNYEVENMRVGNRTDFNKLRLFLETDGTLTPREALEKSIEIMIKQLKAVVGFIEEEVEEIKIENTGATGTKEENKEIDTEFLKTRIETLDLSSRTINALTGGNIRTIGGLARKKEKDLGELEGLGAKGINEIKDLLAKYNITLK
ncbi:MAG: DNA-directed RNA polymerase subunit alpha [Minisyncoccia bacterium]